MRIRSRSPCMRSAMHYICSASEIPPRSVDSSRLGATIAMESQITVRLPGELAERLERLALERGVGRSQLVREALQAFLERPAAPEVGRPFDRVRDLAGVVHGGPPDLGARYRGYLRGLFVGR